MGRKESRFWRGRRVLITGYEGFLGSNLTRKLAGEGADIVGLDIATGRKDTILDEDDYRKIEVVRGSVCDYALLRRVIGKRGIEVIFHLAAEVIVGKCTKNPMLAFESNIRGTWTVLEAARNLVGVKAIVAASSDKAYGSHRKLPYREDTALRGDHPYDVSKSCSDLLARTYFLTYGLPVAVTRCGNIYGPGDFNFTRIVPEAMSCLVSGRKLKIRSDGKFTRDYVYVRDIVDGYILIAEKMKKLGLAGESFNFSDENPVTVVQLVNRIYRLAGEKPNYRILDRAKYEIKHQYLASGKARKVLGWKPGHSLEEGLERTISWYKENVAGGWRR
jgi:CDP-glucose 4,6-dehydratase